MDDYEFGFWRKEGDPQGTPPPPPVVHRYVDRVRIKGDPKKGAIPPQISSSPPKKDKKLNYTGPICHEESKSIPGFAGYRVYPNGQVYYKDREVKPWGSANLISLVNYYSDEKKKYCIKLFDLLAYLFLSDAWHSSGKRKLKLLEVNPNLNLEEEIL